MLDWISTKLMTYLRVKEGLLIEKEGYIGDMHSITVRDAFGYRYEILVRPLGRIYSERPGFEIDFVDIPKANANKT